MSDLDRLAEMVEALDTIHPSHVPVSVVKVLDVLPELLAVARAASRHCRGCDAGHEVRGVGARMPPSHYEAGRWVMWCQALPASRALAARLAEECP